MKNPLSIPVLLILATSWIVFGEPVFTDPKLPPITTKLRPVIPSLPEPLRNAPLKACLCHGESIIFNTIGEADSFRDSFKLDLGNRSRTKTVKIPDTVFLDLTKP